MVAERQKKSAILAGVGLDNQDGHRRVTKGDNFFLIGGSEETHETMTETAIKFNEQLKRCGKNLADLSNNEFNDLMQQAGGKA